MEGQLGLSELSVISWVSTFQGCPLSGVPLYNLSATMYWLQTNYDIVFLFPCCLVQGGAWVPQWSTLHRLCGQPVLLEISAMEVPGKVRRQQERNSITYLASFPALGGIVHAQTGSIFFGHAQERGNEAITDVHLFAINRIAIWSLQHHRWPAYNFSNHCMKHVPMKTRMVFSKLLPKIIFMGSVLMWGNYVFCESAGKLSYLLAQF